MKKLIQLFFLASFMLFATGLKAQKPQIVLEKLEQDMGTFKESDGPQTTTFKFTNKGTVPLVLSSVRASCGCTTPKWTSEPVAHQGTGEIQVSYDPKNSHGSFNKTVMVSSNAENGTTVLRITGRVAEREKTLTELYPLDIGVLRA